MKPNQQPIYYLKIGDSIQKGDILQIGSMDIPLPEHYWGTKLKGDVVCVRRPAPQMTRLGFAAKILKGVPKRTVQSKRPIREDYFTEDDILNLNIALETSETMEEFFKIT